MARFGPCDRRLPKGFGVDQGVGGYVDVRSARWVAAGDPLRNELGPELERVFEGEMLIGPKGAHLAVFRTGLGDGLYGSWWGVDDRDVVRCLITDFGIACA